MRIMQDRKEKFNKDTEIWKTSIEMIQMISSITQKPVESFTNRVEQRKIEYQGFKIT
jgi:hypothetical protein